MAVSLEQTGDLLRRSGGVVNQAVDRGTSMLADRIEHYTNVARDVGQTLRTREEPQAAAFVEMLSQRGNDVARYLRGRDGARLWNDAQDFARGRTWLLAGIGFVTGVAAARTVRTAAAGTDQYDEYVDSYASPESRYAE